LALAAAGLRGSDFRPVAGDSTGLVEAAVRNIVARGSGTLVESGGVRPLREADAGRAAEVLLAGEAMWVDEPAEPSLSRAVAVPATTLPPATATLAPGQFWLITFDAPAIQGGRVLNRPMMMELSGLWHGLAWETWLEIHHEDAQAVGVVSGDRVVIRGPRAEIRARVVVTGAIARYCVAVPLGMGHRALGDVARGHGANPLDLPHASVDSDTGVPILGPVPVFLEKA